MKEPYRRTGRTTEMLIEALKSTKPLVLIATPNHRMAKYLADRMYDMIKTNSHVIRNDPCTILLRHQVFKFIVPDRKENRGLRNFEVFADHTVFESMGYYIWDEYVLLKAEEMR